jgi:predicted phosphate transport protein (TIGR00153 family)
MPVYRGDFFELVEMIDKIANQAEYVSNMLKLTRMEIPAKYKEGLLELIDGVIKTFNALKKSVILLHENIEKVVSAITEVRNGEKKVDDISEQLVENVFKDGRPSAMDLIRAHILSALIREISEIADLAEDTSDHLMKHVGKMII